MTPRTLLTTIGGTAIAFAMAIIVAASTVPGTATQRDETVTPATMYAVQTSRDMSVERMRVASWDEPCLFAL